MTCQCGHWWFQCGWEGKPGYESHLSTLTHCVHFRTTGPWIYFYHHMSQTSHEMAVQRECPWTVPQGSLCAGVYMNKSQLNPTKPRNSQWNLVFLKGKGMKKERRAIVCLHISQIQTKGDLSHADHWTVMNLNVQAGPYTLYLSAVPTVHELINNSEGQNPAIKQLKQGKTFFFYCTQVKSTAAYSQREQTMATAEAIFIFLFRFGFYRLIGDCKEMPREILCTPPPAAPNMNILNNYSTIPNSRSQHWYNPQSLLRLYCLYMHSCIHMSMRASTPACTCNLITCITLYNHYHNQDTSICPHKTLSPCHFTATHTHTPIPFPHHLNSWQPIIDSLCLKLCYFMNVTSVK